MLVLAVLYLLLVAWAVRSAMTKTVVAPHPYAYEYSSVTRKLTMKYPDQRGKGIDVRA